MEGNLVHCDAFQHEYMESLLQTHTLLYLTKVKFFIYFYLMPHHMYCVNMTSQTTIILSQYISNSHQTAGYEIYKSACNVTT